MYFNYCMINDFLEITNHRKKEQVVIFLKLNIRRSMNSFSPTSVPLVSTALVVVLVLMSPTSSRGASLLRRAQSNNYNEKGLKIQENPWLFEVDMRVLQFVSGTDFNNTSFDTADGSDAGLLNRLIALLLPVVNTAFKILVPEFLALPSADRFNVGELNLFVCRARADMSYDLGAIKGLNSMAIESLTVRKGTENVNFRCFETLWNAAFEMTIASDTNFTVGDLGAGVWLDGCGLDFVREFGGGVNTFKPRMSGTVNISGALQGRTALIDFANIAESLTVDYDSIEAYMNDVPAEFNEFITNATREVSGAMKEELIDTVEPSIKPVVQESLLQSRSLSYGEYLSINSGFASNAVKRQAVSFYQSATSFFGFGGKDEAGGNGEARRI